MAQLAEAAGIAAAVAGGASAEPDICPRSTVAGAFKGRVAKRDAADQVAIGIRVEHDGLAARADAGTARDDVGAGPKGQAPAFVASQVYGAIDENRRHGAGFDQQAAGIQIDRVEQDVSGAIGTPEGDLRESRLDVAQRGGCQRQPGIVERSGAGRHGSTWLSVPDLH